MKFRNYPFLLVLIVLAATLTVPAAVAQEEPVNVAPYLDGAVYEASTEQEVHIYWFWVALNRGLVDVYLDASHESYALQGPGTSLAIADGEAEQYWSPVIQVPPEVAGWDCPRPLGAASIFDYNLGHLDPGTYTLTFVRTIDNPVTDALHVCTIDDHPLADAPSLLAPGTTVSTVTINVSAPD